MITTENINSILGIKEAFQLHDALKNILFDKIKREETFNRFLEIESNLSYDWFTNYFQEEQANRKGMMQDYTPDCICKLLKELNAESNQSSLFDCCSGIGGLTISMWLENKEKTFYLEELSDNSMMMLLFNLSIRGINAYVRHGDVLTNKFKAIYKLTNKGRFSDIELLNEMDNDFQVDTIISNPPYSLKFDRVEEYKYDKRFANYGIPPKAKADYAFILHALSHLKENGTMYFILPHGVLFRGAKEGNIRKNLIDDNLLDCVIGLPDKLFLNTSIPVCIMIFKKNRKSEDILFIDSSKNFLNEGKQNKMTKEHIEKIRYAYQSRKDIDKFSHVASLNEIEENDYNLNIPRYVDTFEEQEPVDIAKTIEEIVELENQIHDIDLELAKMFGELQGPQDYELEKAKIVEHLTNRYIHDVSNAMNKIFTFMNTEKQLANYKEKPLLELVNIERSKKNKVYSKGSILIQLSATRGQMLYLEKESTVDSKYGVMTIKDSYINSKYLYYMLSVQMEHFLRIYQTGLNIVPDIFKYMKLQVHDNRNIQDKIQTMFDEVEKIEKAYQEDIENWKNIKQYHLENMFV